MVEYFNRYAYIEIALYGKSYISAARDTWRLFKDRGIDALVNDSLVGMTLTWGAYIVGISCSLFGYLYLRYTHPAYNDDGNYTPIVLFFAFIIGVQCCTYYDWIKGWVMTTHADELSGLFLIQHLR
jgi:uncharacterized membrane protein YecN with MAPEG domain